MTDRVEIYKDDNDEWRFRRIAANGEIVASGESYRNQVDAAKTARNIFPAVPVVLVDEKPPEV